MTRVHRRLSKAFAQAIVDFQMISNGDRILCAVSGGKDSYAMHRLLFDLKKKAPVSFEIIAVNIDQGHPGYPGHLLTDYMKSNHFLFRMESVDTHTIVKEKIPEGKTFCSLCSRLRRGILYRVATELKCTKIALGHHRDDAIITLFLNLIFSGQLKSMPPKLVTDNKEHLVIRPLIYCAEEDLESFALEQAFPIIPCDLCGSQENLQRQVIKKFLRDFDHKNPGARRNMLAALRNVRPSHLLDKGLWKKLNLEVAEESDDEALFHESEVDQIIFPSENLIRNA